MAPEQVTDFLATVSHEIRTPMNGIIGMAELLMRTELGDVQRDYSRWILKSANNLMKIIDQILDYSKAVSGKMTLEQERFNLRMLCEEVTELLLPEAAAKDVALSFRCSHDIPARLFGDVGRIRQVLLNLVGNAVKFTDCGRVQIGATCEEQADQQARIVIRVVDTGIGIHPDKVPLLFRKYSRVESPDGRTYGGTGLGLAISKALIEMMQGEIGVESSYGEGSVFWIALTLPIASHSSPETEYRAAPASAAEECKGLRVLLVEDDPSNRIVTAAMLQSIGCRAEVACNGREAVEMVTRNSYDIVFMDCCMPLMNGFKAVAEIRKRERRRRTVIVALTANTSGGYREKCLKAGMDDYLSKPVRYHELHEMVIQWNQHHRKNADGGMLRRKRRTGKTEEERGLDEKKLRDASSMVREAGRDFFPDVVEPYLLSVEESIPVLQRALEQKQLCTLRETVHRLYGGSSSLGMGELSRVCSTILEYARRNNVARVVELVGTLEHTLSSIREQVYAMKQRGVI